MGRHIFPIPPSPMKLAGFAQSKQMIEIRAGGYGSSSKNVHVGRLYQINEVKTRDNTDVHTEWFTLDIRDI